MLEPYGPTAPRLGEKMMHPEFIFSGVLGNSSVVGHITRTHSDLLLHSTSGTVMELPNIFGRCIPGMKCYVAAYEKES